MKKLSAVLMVCFVWAFRVAAQDTETVTVTTIKANLRGTPSMTGIVVTTVNNGEVFELIKEKAPWYLVQTPKYVGWIHGNSITLEEAKDDPFEKMARAYVETTPRQTSKPVTGGDSPFQREYVGGDTTAVYVQNETDRTLTLVFGGVTYKVAAGGQRTFNAAAGRYEYHASVPRAVPISGVKEFGSGYRFSWRFFIVRR